jgi:hypothetical protein
VKPDFPDPTSGHERRTLDGQRSANQQNVGVGRVNPGDLLVIPPRGPPQSLRDLHLLPLPGFSVLHQATR